MQALKAYLLIVLCFVPYLTWSQSFIGLDISNYAGSNAAYHNPAMLADSRYSVHVNLIGAGLNASTNYIAVTSPVSPWNIAWNYDFRNGTLPEQYTIYSDEVLYDEFVTDMRRGDLNLEVRGPAFMYSLPSNKISFGMGTRFRTFAHISNLSKNFFDTVEKIGTTNDDLTDAVDDIQINESDFAINLHSYREYSFSAAAVVADRNDHFLKAGLGFKYIIPMASASVLGRQLDMNFRNSELALIQDYDLQYAYTSDRFYVEETPTEFKFRSDQLWNSRELGRGFGFDFGLVYEYRPNKSDYVYKMDGESLPDQKQNKYKLRAGVALRDLGSIQLSNVEYVRNNRANNLGSLGIFDGLRVWDDVKNVKIEGGDDVDSLLDDILGLDQRLASYTVGLPTTLNINVDYQLYKNFYLNVDHSVNLQNRMKITARIPTFTTLTPRFEHRWFEAALSISMQDGWEELRSGLYLRAGPAFIGSANLGQFVSSGPKNSFNLYAGLTVPIFKPNKKDRDKDGVSDRLDKCRKTPGPLVTDGCPDDDRDGVPNFEDNCPDVKGVAQFNGCPDSDRDNVVDSLDKCPKSKGTPETDGCPDSDEDGVLDSEDLCKMVPGPVEFMGCPDTDGDSIPDSKDECPEISGIAAFNGCPDTDGDSIPDKLDKCPELAGGSSTEGCPDDDGDGVSNADDKCPELAGTVAFEGCPDEDNDGVPNHLDRCLSDSGSVANKGCPEAEVNEKIEAMEHLNKEEKLLLSRLWNIEFDPGVSFIKTEWYGELRDLGAMLSRNPSYTLKLEGYTDNTGSRARNLKLSLARATAIKQFLVYQGIEGSRIETIGYGPDKPLASNATEAGREQNRRVEMTVIKD